MTYTFGTVTDANPASTFMTAMDTVITAESGWSFVETYTSGNDVTNIYKSAGSVNSSGTDFYMGLNRTATTATTVQVVLFEQWDAVNKRAKKYAPNGAPTANSNVPDTDYTVKDATGVLPSATTANASLFKGAGFTLIANPSSTVYHVNITADRMIWTTDRGVGGYCGLGDALVTNPMPLVVCVFDGFYQMSNGYGAMTREPLQTASASGNWHVMFLNINANGNGMGYTTIFGFFQMWVNSGTVAGVTADVYTGSRLAQRCAPHSARSTATYTTSGTMGWPILLKDVLISTQGSSNAALDTMSYTLSGVTYNYVKAYTGGTGTFIGLPNLYIPKQ